jgi:CubicO group peptidase (beta-lactamase class C family)
MIAPMAIESPAVVPRDSTAARTVEELLARIRRIMDSSGTPGASLAIVRGDSVIYANGLGLARVSPPQPATANTLFRIGSTSKLFIGLTALTLEQEGRMSLDRPLASAYPSYRIHNDWESTDTLRLVHLLEHTSGIDDNSLRAYASTDPRPLTLEDGLAIDAKRQLARWRPGSRFAYTNTGPAIVARVIETVMNAPFESIVQTRWFDRLGMRTATYFEPDASAPMATLYVPGRDVPVPYWHPFARPIGSINASATDMAALLRLLTGRGVINGDTLIAPALLERAEHARTWVGTRHGITEVGYGLGLYRTEGTDGRLWAGHSGGVEGGLSDLSYLPEYGVGYSLQINAMRGRALQLMAEEVRRYLTRTLPAVVPPAPAPVATIMEQQYTGWYRPVTPRPQIVAAFERLLNLARVRVDGQRVRVEPLLGNASVFVALDTLRFRSVHGTAATLAFHANEANSQRPAMQGFNSGATYLRLPWWDVAGTFFGTASWLTAFLFGPLLALMLSARWLWQRMHRVSPSPEENADHVAAWWCAAGASGAVALFCWAALTGFQDLQRLGNLTPLSLTVAAAPFAYLLMTAAGLRLAWRGAHVLPALHTRVLRRALQFTMLAHAVGAIYATRYGIVFFIPWA